ncbi:MAG: hypothetical protein FJX60_22060 [Alphaproteobacteria bacterium]|nr:hypothetical protein [Alphaproteobacteria bacterium]
MSTSSAALSGRRVLVVDADDDRARTIAATLAAAGGTIDTASDIHRALDLLEEAEPAFAGVLIAERLADADGVVLARAVRTSPLLCNLRLVALAAGTPSEEFDVACGWPTTPASLIASLVNPPPTSGAAPEGAAPVLDLAELESIAGGLTAELAGMLRRFADQAQRMAAEAMAAASATDAPAAKGYAHALKGAAFSAGAMRLGRAAKSFEAAAAAADWPTASSIDLVREARDLARPIHGRA